MRACPHPTKQIHTMRHILVSPTCDYGFVPRSVFIRLLLSLLSLFLLSAAIFAQTSPAAAPVPPPDLRVELRSATAPNRFRLGEEIPLEVVISTTTPNRYLEPCALFREANFGSLQCPFFTRWTFSLAPADGWADYTKIFPGPMTFSGPSFAVPRRDLTAEPETFPYRLTDRFRFDRPGHYRLSLELTLGLDDETTQPGAVEHVAPHSVTVTRELDLEIVPADPSWQKQIVRDGEQAYSKPQPPVANSADFERYNQATRALCILGTPEAAAVLVEALAQNRQEARTCLERTRDIPAAIAELQRRLVDPTVAVNTTFFQTLVLLQNFVASQKAQLPLLSQAFMDADRDTLFASLPKKQPDAQIVSLATVLGTPVRANSGKSNGMDLAYDLPFTDSVIAAAAASFERLPVDLQRQLLQEAWPRIQSPLMLPVVRHLAEAGSGPALLRWQELDPNEANNFIRVEIARPQPRFSSYYLRLPDRSLPAQEQQLAANFINASAQSNDQLVHAATLLHRYATRNVLPTVLPVIDDKFLGWSCSIQLPLLAYIIKVAPDEAAPRIEKLLASSNRNQQCTSRTLTTLGAIASGPTLDKIALAEIDAATPNAPDAAHYLEQYGGSDSNYVSMDRTPPLKQKIWEQLKLAHERWVSTGGEKRMQANAGTPQDGELRELVGALTDAYEKAQAWVLTPEDEARLTALLGNETIAGLKCVFHCGGALGIGPGVGEFSIYSNANADWREVQDAREAMEYLHSPERLQYFINQYQCPGMNSLKQKMAQFPPGSTFVFAYNFSREDRAEIVEIANFLWEHGYKTKNIANWPFLPHDPQN